MAKSIRSKQKRKMRAIKRVRYGQKELKRLVEMVKKSEQNEKQAQEEMQAIAVKKFQIDVDENPNQNSDYISMETDQNERDKKTLLNKFGQYPDWMNGRRLKRQKTLVKKLKKKRSKV
ncbi:protein LLP homolog [Dermatophagoides farinae]|uniref:Protein llp-like protein n=1 Tax=Dermatophagoides farinae TaxID=6954 RepID=A0A922HYT6_DERFA|nr:uncharacterized protein C12orf31 homolog [Dermatophagoides farinae]KAH7637015.1 protein llp-like protein [Dermatophagoides farinae]KAH9510766.1 hypothetical protein DERF_009274 [Dermatophagoides farinae]